MNDRDRHREDQGWKRQDRIHQAHHHAVAHTTERSGEQPDEAAHERSRDGDDRRDHDRDTSPVRDASQHVAPQLVGPKGV
jgi:hypothetical protein